MPKPDEADDAKRQSLLLPSFPDLRDDLHVLTEGDDRVGQHFADTDGEAL